MPVRVTLAKNAKQTVRSVVVLRIDESPERVITSILETAGKKLRLKKANRVFFDDGVELTPDQQHLARISNDTVLFISTGEPFVGSKTSTTGTEPENTLAMIKVLGSDDFQTKHIEPQAVVQLKAMAKLQGITRAIGMPDLHPGDKYPIGATFESKGCIYPALIGGDVGCGMALFQTRLPSSANPKRLCDKLRGIEGPWKEGSPKNWLASYGYSQDLPSFEENLGTIGGGNHFAELQEVERICDRDTFASLGLDEGRLVLLVHSGSRGLGKHIAKDQPSARLVEGTPEFDSYLEQHHWACNWAKANRDLIAHRIFSCLGTTAEKILDIWHNNVTGKRVEGEEMVWIHRKGAAPSDGGAIVIPGSRGALSYLVLPVGDQRGNSFSVAHGAGRSLTRGLALGKFQNKAKTVNESAAALQETSLGSRVICEDFNLLFEEAPEAYKDVEAVVEELVKEGIVTVIASFKPVVTYKKRTQD